MKDLRRFALVSLALAVLALPLSASARPLEAVSTFEYTQNMHPLGHSFFGNTPNFPGQTFTANSDIAFWGKHAYQGHYEGFRIVDVSAPGNPREVSFTSCFGNQGDIIVWDDILVRSWNSPATGTGSSQLVCDGVAVPAGWEGVHVFDISDPADPAVVGSVETDCGSHTATGVPDLANNRLLVYNNSSSGACPGIDIIEVPLDDPAGSSLLRFESAGRSCHDTAVILGDVLRAACSGGGGFSMFSLGGARGGSLEDPELLYSKPLPGLGGHSASFTWDGEVYIHGWEPGGGSGPRCTKTGTQVTPTTVQTDDMKSYFFFDPETGDSLGKFVMPRDQTLQENCTIHNYNVVPTDKRYVLVSGNYQSGISVVDFSDPANASEIAFADPAPLVPTQLGGDWSTYWYNGLIYESDITRGLLVWNLSDRATAGARKLEHLNPQTQEWSY
jgi:hypothetical protein